MILHSGPTRDQILSAIDIAARRHDIAIDVSRLEWFERWVRLDGQRVGPAAPGQALEFVLTVGARVFHAPFNYGNLVRALAMKPEQLDLFGEVA